MSDIRHGEPETARPGEPLVASVGNDQTRPDLSPDPSQSAGDSELRERPDELGGERASGPRTSVVLRGATKHLWRRLNAMDFINRAMLFGAVLLLCFVPFLIIVEALAGRSATTRLIKRFGLSGEAAKATAAVFTSPSETSASVTGLSYVLFVLSGIAVAAAIQELYERAFDLETRGLTDTPRRIVWLAMLVAIAALASWVGPSVHGAGGPVLLAILALVAVTGFWWLTMWLLLGGRVSWRELIPSAVATGIFWLAMCLVFNLTMSSTITSNYKKYGEIGVVLSFMSFLIAIGVVIILGAVIGVVWRLRRTIASDAGAAGASD